MINAKNEVTYANWLFGTKATSWDSQFGSLDSVMVACYLAKKRLQESGFLEVVWHRIPDGFGNEFADGFDISDPEFLSADLLIHSEMVNTVARIKLPDDDAKEYWETSLLFGFLMASAALGTNPKKVRQFALDVFNGYKGISEILQ